jgi:FlaA1/EpsC-like NDP-sugar epimerase
VQNLILTQSRRIKQLVQMFFDGLVLYFAYLFSYAHDSGSIYGAVPQLHSAVPLVAIPACIGIFYSFGIYRSLIRYLSANSLVKTIPLPFIAAIIFRILSEIDSIGNEFGWTHMVTFGLISGALGLGGRLIAQSFLLSKNHSDSSNVVIYGAKGLTREFLAAIKQRRDFIPVGVIDADPDLTGALIAGVRIYLPQDLHNLVVKKRVATILVAMSEVSPESQKQLSNLLKSNAVQIKQIPAISDIISGRVSITKFKTIKIEDLLARKPIPAIPELMNVNTSGKSIMVTGAGGSIGNEICRQLIATNPARLVLLDQSEYGLYKIEGEISSKIIELGLTTEVITAIANVCNKKILAEVLTKNGVETVFHAAAYKHVPLLEANVYASLINNVLGTEAIVKASIASGVSSLTMISTDKAVRPTNVMGASKRFAELICQAYAKVQNNTIISMVRFGNVLDSSGSVIPLFRHQISNGGPLTVTHRDMTRYFMTIPEASQLVIQSSAMATDGEVFLLDMGPPVLILNLAKSMIRLSGYQPYLADENDVSGSPSSDQIEIKFSKLRPGEKLYEELLIINTASPTSHPRIMKAAEQSVEFDELTSHLNELKASIENGDVQVTLEMLQRLPLNYSPNFSF